ncbi:MAG: glycoside hydrolase N-terminal domain-containing protein [Kiritimatiellae bacterium]|nr:glycoside hydrolase N-terminal domain-containing protein [Kiritimatiellia bacterium]
MLWKAPLPSDWRYGAPLGNGDFGAVLHGAPRDLTLVFGKTDVWDRRNDDSSQYPGKTFGEVRSAYTKKDRAAYERILKEMAARYPVDMPHLTTCGTLRLHLDEGLNPTGPSLKVCLEDGTAHLAYNDRRVEAAISRDYDMLVVTIDRGVGYPSPNPSYDCYDRQLPFTQLPWEFSRPPLDANQAPEITSEDRLFFVTQRFKAGGSCTVGLGFTGFGTSRQAVLPNRLAGCLEQPKGRQVEMFLTIASSGDSADPVALCRERLRRAMKAGSARVLTSHRQWWHDYWMRGLASVGDDGVEKWYYRSLYLCGSMFRPGKQSPGLQGVWCGENYPVWFADYHGNVNIQCIYWGLFANNRLDMIEPYLRLYEGFAPHAREVARDYYRMRGLKFPHAGSIGGHELTSGGYSRLSTDPCETAWLARLFWDYFRYSRDLDFLARRGYPIIRDAALLLADYLVWDAERGCWTMPPMLHFESRAGEEDGWDINTLYGQAFIRMGLAQAIAASERLENDADLRQEWRDKLDHLAPPPMTADGRWQPWENQPDRYEGHNFTLPLVFPAELVSAWHGPVEWRKQALKTWEYLRDSGMKTLSGGAWCGGQGIGEILRLGETCLAFERARWDEGFPPNGFVIGSAMGSVFIQVDHGPGMCRVLADMLLLEVGGVLRLFAGIPANVPARFHSLRAPGGFVVTAEKRGERPDYAIIRATVTETLRLANPWETTQMIELAGKRVLYSGRDPVIEVALVAGCEYLAVPMGKPLDCLPEEDFRVRRNTDSRTS